MVGKKTTFSDILFLFRSTCCQKTWSTGAIGSTSYPWSPSFPSPKLSWMGHPTWGGHCTVILSLPMLFFSFCSLVSFLLLLSLSLLLLHQLFRLFACWPAFLHLILLSCTLNPWFSASHGLLFPCPRFLSLANSLTRLLASFLYSFSFCSQLACFCSFSHALSLDHVLLLYFGRDLLLQT